MNDQLQDGMKCFWRTVAVYRENNSSGGTPSQYFAAADEIDRLNDQIVVDAGIIKAHFETIERLEAVLRKVLDCNTAVDVWDICRLELPPLKEQDE